APFRLPEFPAADPDKSRMHGAREVGAHFLAEASGPAKQQVDTTFAERKARSIGGVELEPIERAHVSTVFPNGSLDRRFAADVLDRRAFGPADVDATDVNVLELAFDHFRETDDGRPVRV